MKPSPSSTEPLTVVMRVRPLNNKEFKAGAKSIVHSVDDKLVVLMDPHDDVDDILRANRSREKHYIFDHTFSPEATQEEVYCAVVQEKGIIESVLSGYNCTVFAYGATGTGKTHTMLGSQEEPGIMVHTLNNLFKKMDRTKDEMEYQVSMGYLEIYNECVRDLLCPDSGSLELREDASGSITVSNLLDISASSTDVILGMLRMGNTNRTSEPTVANRTSSRSHAILKVNVEQRSRASNVTQEVRCGSLYMVDLAGSERAAITQNRGKRMIEGAHINRSLLALANCINALGSSNSNYVNYRDSKLTRILKEALGGNCKTVMIAHASPASTSYEETRNTMVYADRSKKIKNKTRQNVVDVNHHVTQYLHIIDDLQFQVLRLRSELEKRVTSGTTAESLEARDLCENLRRLTQEQREIRHQLLDLECQLLQNGVECQQQSAYIKAWEEKRDCSGLTVANATSSIFSPLFTPTAEHAIPVEADTSTEALPSISNHAPSLHENHAPISLQQAGHVASESKVPATITTEDHMTGEVATGAGSCVLYKVDKPKEFIRVATHGFPEELLLSFSPDSGTEMSVTAATEGESSEMEPSEVSAAREAVAILSVAKQRLEAQHKRVERILRENKANVAEIRERLSDGHDLLSVKKDMLMDLFQHTSDLEASHAEHSLSSLLMGVHLSQHASVLDKLLHHSATLLDMLASEHKTRLTEVDGMADSTAPDELIQQFKELRDKQKRLEAEVVDVKAKPVLGEKLQVQSVSRLSAKLYSTVAGSKSNLLATDELSNDELPEFAFSQVDQSSHLQLPSISSPRASSRSKKTVATSPLTFPPINTSYHDPLTAIRAKKSPLEVDQKGFPVPLKQSEINQILEAAKKSRDDKIAATLGVPGRAKQRKLPASKFAAFVSPRVSLTQNRKPIPTQQTVAFQAKPSVTHTSSTTHEGEMTEIIDLETSDAASVILNTTSSMMPVDSLQGQNTRSQPHLSTSPFKKPQRSKPVRNQRLRRSRSHARIGSDSGRSKLVERKDEVQTMSMSMEDMSGETEENNRGEETKMATEMKGNSTSRPIIKKPIFVKQNTKPNVNNPKVHSVYGGRPYVIPVAKKIIQQTKSLRHQAAPKIDNVKNKRIPLTQYPRVKRKYHPLASCRQEVPMHKGGKFPSLSPYLSSPTRQGNKNELVAKTSGARTPAVFNFKK